MDEIEKKYFGKTITSLGISSESSKDGPTELHASSLAGLFIIVCSATLLALFVSETYIWSKPIRMAKQLSNKYFRSHPSVGETYIWTKTIQLMRFRSQTSLGVDIERDNTSQFEDPAANIDNQAQLDIGDKGMRL